MFSSKPPTEHDIFNVAVRLSLEWGKNWLAPINKRIRKKYSYLTESDAEKLNARCKEIQRFAWDLCEKERDGKMSVGDINKRINEKYPILDSENVSQLVSQNMYYVRK